jgi:hypothetical protein
MAGRGQNIALHSPSGLGFRAFVGLATRVYVVYNHVMAVSCIVSVIVVAVIATGLCGQYGRCAGHTRDAFCGWTNLWTGWWEFDALMLRKARVPGGT